MPDPTNLPENKPDENPTIPEKNNPPTPPPSNLPDAAEIAKLVAAQVEIEVAAREKQRAAEAEAAKAQAEGNYRALYEQEVAKARANEAKLQAEILVSWQESAAALYNLDLKVFAPSLTGKTSAEVKAAAKAIRASIDEAIEKAKKDNFSGTPAPPASNGNRSNNKGDFATNASNMMSQLFGASPRR